MGDSALFTAGASGVEHRRSIASFGDLTPDMVAKIDWSDKSVRTGLIMAVISACVALIVIFVITRLMVRRLMTGQFFLDDSKSARYSRQLKLVTDVLSLMLFL